MLYIIEQVLDANTVASFVHKLQTDSPHWQPGNLTAGAAAKNQKDNNQLGTQHPDYQALSNTVMNALNNHPVFMSAALPKTILPPIFSEYNQGQRYGNHVDNALQIHPKTGQMLRTDLSLTLFLSDPESYQGGELIIDDAYAEHAIKLNAGDAILYPSTSIHRVNSVTQGKRLAMVTWIQSLVKSNEQRQILHDLDISHILLRQKLLNNKAAEQIEVHDELKKLNQSYHNLLRLWAEC